MPRRTAENADVWRDRVKRWKQSGLTAKAFAELEGLPRPGALVTFLLRRGDLYSDGARSRVLALGTCGPLSRRALSRTTRLLPDGRRELAT